MGEALCVWAGHAPGQERGASWGRLCGGCWFALHGAVVEAPRLVDHLRLVAELGPSGSQLASELPVLSDAVDAADRVHVLVGYLAEVVASARGVPGPDRSGWWVSPSGDVHGLRPSAGDLAEVTRRAATWLLPHLSWVAEQVWAGEVRDVLVGTVVRASDRWPQTERGGRVIPDARCPACLAVGALEYTPPLEVGQAFVVRCGSCERVFPESEFSRMVGLLAEVSGVRGS